MSLEWLKFNLDNEIENGNIYGYVTNTKSDVQLKNYMEKQHVPEAVPIIQGKFDTIAILTNMYVNEEERGNGIGTFLLLNFIENAVNKHAEAIVLVADTADTNQFNLVSWYEDYGFEIYYGDKNSFPVMVKTL